MPRIFYKIFATGRPDAKTLIKYNNNNLEEKDEVEKEPIDIELTEQKADPEMMKMLLTLNDQAVQEEDEEDIALANFIENYKTRRREIFCRKSNLMIA